jgi:hypothetical protein
MYKIGDWVVRTVDGGPIGGVGALSRVLQTHVSSVEVDRRYGGNETTTWDKDRIRKATKLELLLNGIDTEQETSYTDIKENDT